ncbi:ATP-binding protein [Roseibium sp.]|uniref:sensor histidine kinase n=1 Tax=Roseibium sp. TaxID=1936156 RepID=UPI003A977CDA
MHPSAQTDTTEAPRHRLFLAGCFSAGAAALFLLPLHLALSTPPNLAVVVGCAWLLSHLPIALYLSQTGDLPRAYGASSTAFALFLTVIAWMSGGLTSFALVWLAVVPMEAALSGSRRIIWSAAGLCAAMLATLALLPAAPAWLVHGLPHGYETLGTVLIGAGATLYMMVLALRLSLAQSRQADRAAAGEQKVRQISQLSRDVTCRLRQDGSAEIVSGSLPELLGLARHQIRGDWLFDRVLVSDRPGYLSALADAREGKGTRELTVRLRRGATTPGQVGRADYMPFRLQFLREMEATPHAEPAVFVSLRDDSASQEMAQKLEAAYAQAGAATQDKARFISTAAHEMRTPLNAIIGFSDLLRKPAPGLDAMRQQSYADLINRSGRHLLQVVEDMLDSSVLENGTRRLTIEPVDLRPLAEDCIAMLQPLAAERDLTLCLAPRANYPVVAADAQALRQVLINLLGNAIKFSNPGGRVTLTSKVEDRDVLLEVRDNGCGISVDDLARIGEPFVRCVQQTAASSSDGSKLTIPGAGLGLFIAKGLCALHGGALELESQKNQGTTARVRLPLGAPTQRSKQGAGQITPAVAEALAAMDPAQMQARGTAANLPQTKPMSALAARAVAQSRGLTERSSKTDGSGSDVQKSQKQLLSKTA